MTDGAVLWRRVWEAQVDGMRDDAIVEVLSLKAFVNALCERLIEAGFDAETYMYEGTLAFGVTIKGRRADFLKARAICPERGRFTPMWEVAPGAVQH